MADPSLTLAAVQAADLKSLDYLYDYTKFHIGLYLTLASAFITVASLRKGEGFLLDLRPPFVRSAMACFLLAGLAAGIIVSSITQCYGLEASALPNRCSSSEEFLAQSLGPWQLEMFSGRLWTWIEHTAFWLGLLLAIASFQLGREPRAATKEPLTVLLDGAIQVRRAPASGAVERMALDKLDGTARVDPYA